MQNRCRKSDAKMMDKSSKNEPKMELKSIKNQSKNRCGKMMQNRRSGGPFPREARRTPVPSKSIEDSLNEDKLP